MLSYGEKQTENMTAISLIGYGENANYAKHIFARNDMWSNIEDAVINTIPLRRRASLYEWLGEVCHVLGVERNTSFLSYHLTDLYMSKVTVTQEKWQLVSLGALLIAAKICNEDEPELYSLHKICNKVVTEKQIRDMEHDIVLTLDWRLFRLTPADVILNIDMPQHVLDQALAVADYLCIAGYNLTYAPCYISMLALSIALAETEESSDPPIDHDPNARLEIKIPTTLINVAYQIYLRYMSRYPRVIKRHIQSQN